MPTFKQKEVAKKILENVGNKSQGQILRESGYSEAIVKNPSHIMESKGVKQALAEYGLTEELVSKALVEDIELKPQNRSAELRLASEVLGMKDAESKGDTNVQINIVNFNESDDTPSV